jgi:hypothetical protein
MIQSHSLQGVFYALTGKHEQALDCINRACASPKSFGHAHHTYYQITCILALAGKRQPAFEWLERSVSTGFDCWLFFLKDHSLQSLHGLPEFELLVSSLQAKYPEFGIAVAGTHRLRSLWSRWGALMRMWRRTTS